MIVGDADARRFAEQLRTAERIQLRRDDDTCIGYELAPYDVSDDDRFVAESPQLGSVELITTSSRESSSRWQE